jgi:hypothetical protein
MFRSTVTDSAAEPAPEVFHDGTPVPLSVLTLDLAEPVEGWHAFLAARGVEVVDDDLGRASVSRDAARQLLTEQREREAEQARRRKLLEARQVADDQIRRAQIWQGIPADDLPPGVAPAAVMLQADRDARPRRQSVLQEVLAGSETLTYHPLPASGEE